MEVLREKLEVATDDQFKLLQDQINSDKELKKLLASPMEKIPQYKWIYHELYDYLKFGLMRIDVKKMSLFSMMKGLTLYPGIRVFFSKVGIKFVGFLSYMEKGKEITSIKIASFKDAKLRSNTVLAGDLIDFLAKEIYKRSTISWVAHKENVEAVGQYDSLLNARRFVWEKEEERGTFWKYTVRDKR